jgi:hypothetical protein
MIKDQAIVVNNAHKKMVNANSAVMAYGNNRIGIRGGRFTTLQAKAEIVARNWINETEKLKYMVRSL